MKKKLLDSNIVVCGPKPEFACPELRSGMSLGPRVGGKPGYEGGTDQGLQGTFTVVPLSSQGREWPECPLPDPLLGKGTSDSAVKSV